MRRNRQLPEDDGLTEDDENPSVADAGDAGLTAASSEALELLTALISVTRPGDEYNRALRHIYRLVEQQAGVTAEAVKAIAEYEEAYNKLIAPANRIAVCLGTVAPEDPPAEGSAASRKSRLRQRQKVHAGTARIAVGDQEYLANIDPAMEEKSLGVGVQVRINDAFAIVGALGYAQGGSVVKVNEVMPDGRLRVSLDSQGSQSRIVYRGDSIRDAIIKSGAEVRVEPHFKVAIECYPAQQGSDYYLEEVPELPWSMVGGQDEAIRVINDAIEAPLLHAELFERFKKRPLKGILLYGPPGCGKTLIGKATAWNITQAYKTETGRNVKEYFMYISGPKILNMWLGESERMVRDLFAQAREKAADGCLVFIFIDEAESLLRTRSGGRWMNISNTLVPQFCAEMDGLVSLDNVVVMLTSNRPDYIDPAILRPERLDRKVKVGRPDRNASRDIFRIYLNGMPIDPALVLDHKGDADAALNEVLDRVTDALFTRSEATRCLEVMLRNGSSEVLNWCDLVSGALIKSVVERAKNVAIKRSIQLMSSTEGIRLDDLLASLADEYSENEIFPKGDSLEDWLKLLDYEPERVASVRKPRKSERARATPEVI
ncbi:MAG: AAA family ATPase [Armatimonadetes bacterium]|nr:AAA family ATPase [Armatimonadota bacterium]MDE2207918.1 AAA family ATPase [Armatimonadota bacterium]